MVIRPHLDRPLRSGYADFIDLGEHVMQEALTKFAKEYDDFIVCKQRWFGFAIDNGGG